MIQRKAKSLDVGRHPRQTRPMSLVGDRQSLLSMIMNKISSRVSPSMTPDEVFQVIEKICNKTNILVRSGDEFTPEEIIGELRKAGVDVFGEKFFEVMGFSPVMNAQMRVPLVLVNAETPFRTTSRNLPFYGMQTMGDYNPTRQAKSKRAFMSKMMTGMIRGHVSTKKEFEKNRNKKHFSYTQFAQQNFPQNRHQINVMKNIQQRIGTTRTPVSRTPGIRLSFPFYLPNEEAVLAAFREKYETPHGIRYPKTFGVFMSHSAENENAFINAHSLLHGDGVMTRPKNTRSSSYSFHSLYGRSIRMIPVRLREYQLRLCHEIGKKDTKGMVLYHEAGTGKTLTATACAIEFILENRRKGVDACVVVAAPLSTVDQVWKNEMMERVNVNVSILREAVENPSVAINPEIQFLKGLGIRETTDRKNVLRDMIMIQKYIHERIHIMSHSQMDRVDLIRSFCGGRPMLFILDEAHNINMKPVSRSFVDKKTSGLCRIQLHTSFHVFHIISILAEKCLFLTATPIVNQLADVNNFIRWIDICKSTKDRDAMAKLVSFFLSLADGRIEFACKEEDVVEKIGFMNHVMEYLNTDSIDRDAIRSHYGSYFHIQKRDARNYPVAHYRTLVCNKNNFYSSDFRRVAQEFEEGYKHLVQSGQVVSSFGKRGDEDTGGGDKKQQNTSAAYINEIRYGLALSQSILSPVALEILSDTNIRITNGNRTVLYVALDELKNLFRRKLRELFPGIRVSVIDGSMSSPERMMVAKDFNEKDPEVGHVLIIMPAGREGVNLKKVSNVVFANEVWTQSAYEQIVGRGVRYRSHHGLPQKERTVMVYNLYNDLSNGIPTVNRYMRTIRLSKKKLCKEFEKAVSPL